MLECKRTAYWFNSRIKCVYQTVRVNWHFRSVCELKAGKCLRIWRPHRSMIAYRVRCCYRWSGIGCGSMMLHHIDILRRQLWRIWLDGGQYNHRGWRNTRRWWCICVLLTEFGRILIEIGHLEWLGDLFVRLEFCLLHDCHVFWWFNVYVARIGENGARWSSGGRSDGRRIAGRIAAHHRCRWLRFGRRQWILIASIGG